MEKRAWGRIGSPIGASIPQATLLFEEVHSLDGDQVATVIGHNIVITLSGRDLLQLAPELARYRMRRIDLGFCKDGRPR